jgi:hypothetical protein
VGGGGADNQLIRSSLVVEPFDLDVLKPGKNSYIQLVKKATKNIGKTKKSERLGWSSVKATDARLSRDMVQSRVVDVPVGQLNGAQRGRKSVLLEP